MRMTWCTAAEIFTEEIREHGFAAANLVAAAWSARITPEATRTLLSIAGLLTSGDAIQRAWDKVEPCPSIGDYKAGEEEIAGEIAGEYKRANDIAQAMARIRSQAYRHWAQAKRERDHAEDPPVRAHAQVRMDEAGLAIADIDAAFEQLDQTAGRLLQALQLLGRADEELEDIYEVPLTFVREGGRLPRDGDFLTPAN